MTEDFWAPMAGIFEIDYDSKDACAFCGQPQDLMGNDRRVWIWSITKTGKAGRSVMWCGGCVAGNDILLGHLTAEMLEAIIAIQKQRIADTGLSWDDWGKLPRERTGEWSDFLDMRGWLYYYERALKRKHGETYDLQYTEVVKHGDSEGS